MRSILFKCLQNSDVHDTGVRAAICRGMSTYELLLLPSVLLTDILLFKGIIRHNTAYSGDSLLASDMTTALADDPADSGNPCAALSYLRSLNFRTMTSHQQVEQLVWSP